MEEEREMTLRVKHTIADRVYYIKVRGHESIWEVHRKIAAVVEVEIGQINMLFCHARKLELDTTVSSNKITDGATIFFSWRLDKIAWFHHPSLESLQGIINSPASASALELPTERYALQERGNLTVVGMRGPLGTPFEGGVLLFVAELQGDVLKSLSLLTPIHHPFVFTPMGKALAEARARLKKEAEKIAHPMVPQIQQNIGTSVPEWGTILWQSSYPSFSDLRKQLDGLHNLLSRDLWGKVLVPSSSSAPLLPVWDRWLNDTGTLSFNGEQEVMKEMYLRVSTHTHRKRKENSTSSSTNLFEGTVRRSRTLSSLHRRIQA